MANSAHELALLAPGLGQPFEQVVVSTAQLHHFDRAFAQLKFCCGQGVGGEFRAGGIELIQWLHHPPHHPAHAQLGEGPIEVMQLSRTYNDLLERLAQSHNHQAPTGHTGGEAADHGQVGLRQMHCLLDQT